MSGSEYLSVVGSVSLLIISSVYWAHDMSLLSMFLTLCSVCVIGAVWPYDCVHACLQPWTNQILKMSMKDWCFT